MVAAFEPPPNLDGEPQPPSGGQPPQNNPPGPASNPAINLALVTSTGGLDGTLGQVLIFGTSSFSGQSLGFNIDPTNFNCEEDCEYDFKVEEVKPGNAQTVNKVLIRYRDLGTVNVMVTIKGTDPKTGVPQSKSLPFSIILGGASDKKIKSAYADITCTFEAPQCIITRMGNAGPLCITKVLMIMETDTNPLI